MSYSVLLCLTQICFFKPSFIQYTKTQVLLKLGLKSSVIPPYNTLCMINVAINMTPIKHTLKYVLKTYLEITGIIIYYFMLINNVPLLISVSWYAISMIYPHCDLNVMGLCRHFATYIKAFIL